VEDFREAYSIAQQLFVYDPKKTRLPAATEHGMPILDTDRSEYLVAANWIQHLTHRECILRRYISEGEEAPFIGYVEQTSEIPSTPLDEPLATIKERLLKRRAIPVGDAIRAINQRKTIPLTKSSKGPPKVSGAV
jgi:hypothetical protein